MRFPPEVNAFFIPKAIVSPSLAPENVTGESVAQLFGPIDGTVMVGTSDRCSRIGVPPEPMVTEPLAATSPFPFTLNSVTLLLCPRSMFPALPEAKLLNTPAAFVALVLPVRPKMPVPVLLVPRVPVPLLLVPRMASPMMLDPMTPKLLLLAPNTPMPVLVFVPPVTPNEKLPAVEFIPPPFVMTPLTARFGMVWLPVKLLAPNVGNAAQPNGRIVERFLHRNLH